MFKLAWYNLLHDPIRLITAVTGVVLAVVLIVVQAAIFLGAIRSSSLLVRQADADLWLVPVSTTNADFSARIPERRRYQALGVAGVERAGRMVVGFANWRFRSGRQESVIVVGIESDHPWLPLPMDRLSRLDRLDGVVMDQREKFRFGTAGDPLAIGTRAELGGHAVAVAGFTEGMNSFPITPYVFMAHKRAADCVRMQPGETVFVMIKCAPGADIGAVQRELRRRIPEVEVLTRDEFARRSWHYWVLGTGMGMALGLSAALALIVGMVVVGQTIFTGVLTKIREYGTLKALGFSNRFIGGSVVIQSAIVGTAGYAIGLVASALVVRYWGEGGTAVSMYAPAWMYLALIPLTAVMCTVSSLGAVWRALVLSPAEVFR
ncbi:MAG: ABC transporter permease [Planctomycetota bacterium]|nr:ABC transporter permease [Planctomycetota bacterium]MCZ6697621.1 ABC transporter permease [Planctomycetota bacterium]